MIRNLPSLLLAHYVLLSPFTGGLGAAEIRIKGIPADKLDELVTKVKPRLDFIKTREASSWRADDAAFFFERLMVRAGHVNAQVEWKLPGGNIIELKVIPGVRYKYGVIKANQLGPLTHESLRDYFLQPLVETEAVKVDKAPYISEYSAKGAHNVENFLKSQGYWQAKVALINENYNHTRKRVIVNLNLTEGIKFTLTPPTFKNLPDEEIRTLTSQLSTLVGQTANSQNMNQMNATVVNYYRTHGYHFAQINVDAIHNNGRTTLAFDIQRGKRYIVNDILVEGNKKTKSRRIRRFFDGLKDKDYDENAADKAVTKILNTGAFVSATLSTTPTPEGILALQIEVKEADAKSFQTYTGLGSFEGFILGASYTDLNLRGRLLKFNARGELSERGFLGEASLSEPHFAGEAIQLTLRTYLLQRLFEGFDKTEGGIETSLSIKYLDHYTSRLYLGVSQVNTSTTSLSALELGPENYLHTRVGTEQTIDFRNDTILPSEGFFAKGSYEFGNISGDASTTYQKINFDSSYRFILAKKHFLMTRFSTGAVFAQDTENLPIDIRLFNGGPDSVRSLEFRELGPRSLSDDPLGGEAYWNTSIEYIHSISDPIKGVLFFDVGQVYADSSDWGSFSDPSYAAGFGLRIDLPIGPVRLEYGHNLNRRDGEPSGTVHFSIGSSF